MLSVKHRSYEHIDKTLRVLKKKVDKEGILKNLRARRYHQKPSVRRKLKRKMAQRYR